MSPVALTRTLFGAVYRRAVSGCPEESVVRRFRDLRVFRPHDKKVRFAGRCPVRSLQAIITVEMVSPQSVKYPCVECSYSDPACELSLDAILLSGGGVSAAGRLKTFDPQRTARFTKRSFLIMTISKLALTEKIHQATGLLEKIETQHGPAAFACSFGLEDMVLLDLIAKKAPNIEIFTLDTGRLPDETHALLDRVRDSYTVPVRVYFPDARLVEEWVEQNGPNGFYR